jgi:diguanylate cyclase (GGDEF)-like protein/PAS domain S-box-containing protein
VGEQPRGRSSGDARLAAWTDAFDPMVVLAPVRDEAGELVDLEYVELNPAAEGYLRRSAEELAGTRVLEQFPGEAATHLLRWSARALAGDPVEVDDAPLVSAVTDRPAVLSARVRAVGQQLLLTWRDRTPGARIDLDHPETATFHRLVAENTTDVVVVTAADGAVRWASPSAARVLGWDPSELLGRSLRELVHPVDLQAQIADMQAMREGPGRGRRELRIRTASGDWRWMSAAGQVLTDDEGAVVGGLDALRDVQAEVEAQEALRASEAQFRMIAEHSSEILFRTGADERIEWISPGVEHVLGWAPGAVVGRTVPEWLHPDDTADRALAINDLLAQGRMTYEARFSTADGSWRWLEVSAAPAFDAAGTAIGVVGIARDITDQRADDERLRYLAGRDPLTGLLNRRELLARVGSLLEQGRRSTDLCAVLFVDLDDLKPINDVHGHAGGDHVIVTVAETLRSIVRAEDLVSRFGGDEFVVVLPYAASLDAAGDVAAKIHAALRRPVVLDGVEVPVTVSIGLAVVGPTDDLDSVLVRADRALYRAKQSGKSRTESEPVGG